MYLHVLRQVLSQLCPADRHSISLRDMVGKEEAGPIYRGMLAIRGVDVLKLKLQQLPTRQ